MFTVLILMAFVKRNLVLETNENLVLTAVCEEHAVHDVEGGPIRGDIATVWEVSIYKFIK
jgi:hypothetical protein